MKTYVASSWRNSHQQSVVHVLRTAGHEVYDFRNPPHGRGDVEFHAYAPSLEAGMAMLPKEKRG